jgi:uncharacterized protein (DUF342 family)
MRNKIKTQLSSYQKMKQKHEEKIRQLTDDIIMLVEGKDYVKTSEIKMKWRMKLNLEKAIMFGNPTCELLTKK